MKLREANNGRGIVSLYTPYASGHDVGLRPFSYRSTYMHAKVGIIDDGWLTIGSANLNDRGLIIDIARSLRIDLWAEHLGLPRDEVVSADPITLVDGAWAEGAAENERIMARGDPSPSGCGAPLRGGKMPGSWLLEEVQSLAVER